MKYSDETSGPEIGDSVSLGRLTGSIIEADRIATRVQWSDGRDSFAPALWFQRTTNNSWVFVAPEGEGR